MAVTKRTRTRREILEASERKRARTEDNRRNLRRITIVKDQKVQDLRVRLFKWNETLLCDKFSDMGVIVTQVKNFNVEDEGCGAENNGGGVPEQRVGLFPLKYLQMGWEDEMRLLVVRALEENDVFTEEDMVTELAEKVVSYISSNFRFTRRSLTSSRTRRIVVFIEVDLVTTQEYCDIEDDGEQKVEDGNELFEDEYDDRLDQFEGNSAEFDMEETRGEEDDDADEEEGNFVDFDMSEDNYVGPDTQETVEEEEDNLTTQDLVETEDSDTCQRGGREEDGDQEDDNIEEEDSHRLDHQSLEDIDQSAENYSMDSDTEEEYGYDDRLDPPFSPFHQANNYVVTDTGEIEGEEDDQSFVDSDPEGIGEGEGEEDEQSSDPEEIGEGEEDEQSFVNSNPAEIGEEEEEEDGSSDPELAEIEDILWWFLKPEHFSRADTDRSRDCKGLKQVKEAMEIITKEICSKGKEMDPCSLCLEGLAEGEAVVVRTNCSHFFHRKCLCSWLSIKDSCPLCRSRCATVV